MDLTMESIFSISQGLGGGTLEKAMAPHSSTLA